MSLDLTLYIKYCPSCGNYDNYYSFNYTYNLSRMWKEATGDVKMIPIEGTTGAESLNKLQAGYEELSNNPDKYKHLEPDNGWGDYTSFLVFLLELIEYAKDYPEGKWKASR